MSVRAPRRRFATPFVVTLAAIPACTTTSAPPPQVQPQPRPEPAPVAEQPAQPEAPVVVANPPPPAPPVVVVNENPPPPQAPAPEPAKFDSRWTVMKTKGQAECKAFVDVKCPTAAPGKPVPTCNPPPPIAYACPDGFQDGQTMKIVLRAGDTECYVDHGPVKCPPGTKCNPPAPRKVPCPTR